jgi:hypothetical protein
MYSSPLCSVPRFVGRSNNRRHNSTSSGFSPNPSHLPSQAEVTNNPNPPTRLYSLHTPQHNSFDLFLVSSESESDNPPSTPTKANPPVRPAPKLASRPTGKLARRRQNVGGVPSTATPSKALSVPRPLLNCPLSRTARRMTVTTNAVTQLRPTPLHPSPPGDQISVTKTNPYTKNPPVAWGDQRRNAFGMTLSPTSSVPFS